MKHARIALAAAFLCFAALPPLAAADLDLVVMVDTSTSMFPYFDELMNYLIQDLMTAKLHDGDTFHLLSFASTPEEELSLDMGSDEAARKAFGRLLLLQPLGRYTDLIAALLYLDRYVRGLPEINPKTILILTDGVHDPPPGSPYRGTPDQIRAKLEEVVGNLKKGGWTVHILKVPPKPVAGEEGLESYLPDIARILDVPIVPYQSEDKTHVTGQIMGFPTLEFPPALGKVGSRFRAPFRVQNFKNEPLIVNLSGVESDGVEMLERPVSITVPPMATARLDVPIELPSSLAPGEYRKIFTLSFDEDLRISPTEGELSFTYRGASGISFSGVNPTIILYIVVAAAAAAGIVLLILFVRKKVHDASAGIGSMRRHAEPRAEPGAESHAGPNEQPPRRKGGRSLIPLMESGTMPGSASAPAMHEPPTVEKLKRSLPSVEPAASGLPRMIEMRVSEQNSHVGFRNIHRIPEGASRTIGGGFSAYLIFLVPVPGRIAEIRNDGGTYTFTPLRVELFPGIKGSVRDCLGVEIPMVTPKGLRFTLRFRPWISPLDEINALMRLSRS